MAQPLNSVGQFPVSDQYQSSSSASACYGVDHISGAQSIPAQPKYTQSNLHAHQMGLTGTNLSRDSWLPMDYHRLSQQEQCSQSQMAMTQPHQSNRYPMQLSPQMAYQQYGAMQQQAREIGRAQAQDAATCSALVQRVAPANSSAIKPAMATAMLEEDVRFLARPLIGAPSLYDDQTQRLFHPCCRRAIDVMRSKSEHPTFYQQRPAAVHNYQQYLKQRKQEQLRTLRLEATKQRVRAESAALQLHTFETEDEPVCADAISRDDSDVDDDEKAQTLSSRPKHKKNRRRRTQLKKMCEKLCVILGQSYDAKSAAEIVSWMATEHGDDYDSMQRIIKSPNHRSKVIGDWQTSKLFKLVSERYSMSAGAIVDYVIRNFSQLEKQYMIQTPKVLFEVAAEYKAHGSQ